MEKRLYGERIHGKKLHRNGTTLYLHREESIWEKNYMRKRLHKEKTI